MRHTLIVSLLLAGLVTMIASSLPAEEPTSPTSLISDPSLLLKPGVYELPGNKLLAVGKSRISQALRASLAARLAKDFAETDAKRRAVTFVQGKGKSTSSPVNAEFSGIIHVSERMLEKPEPTVFIGLIIPRDGIVIHTQTEKQVSRKSAPSEPDRKNQPEEAIAKTPAQQESYDDLATAITLAESLVREGKCSDAAELLSNLRLNSPLLARYQQIDMVLQMKTFAEEEPKSAMRQYLLAKALADAGMYADAVDAVIEACDLYESDTLADNNEKATACFLAADILKKLKMISDADAYAKKAIYYKQNPRASKAVDTNKQDQ